MEGEKLREDGDRREKLRKKKWRGRKEMNRKRGRSEVLWKDGWKG